MKIQVQAGAPSYPVFLGRRDGLESNGAWVDLPSPSVSWEEGYAYFKSKSLDAQDYATLLGNLIFFLTVPLGITSSYVSKNIKPSSILFYLQRHIHWGKRTAETFVITYTTIKNPKSRSNHEQVIARKT